jgi:hypothetical protein
MLTLALELLAAASPCTGADIALENAVRPEPQTVPQGGQIDLALPAFPEVAGKAVLLRFRAVILTAGEGGCNYNASVRLNGAPLGRRTAGGQERLIAREPVLQLTAGDYPAFSVFSGDKLMMMFAPDVTRGDAMTSDGLGATFTLDVSDVARAADGNTLTFRNELPGVLPEGQGALRVEAIEVGWLDRASLPQPPSLVPQRGPIAASVAAGGMRLSQSTRGGFAAQVDGGPELLVETAVGMQPNATSVLVADDASAPAADVSVETQAWGSAGFVLTASWPGLSLRRTLRLQPGCVEWKEQWRNTGDTIRGVPFRHRCFLRSESARFRVGGSPDAVGLATSACNPTLFLESARTPGIGWGLTAESDWLRLLLGLSGHGGVGEVYTATLALAPGASLELDLSLEPVTDGGGYWSFINGVRRRWGVNGITQERPVFWGYTRSPEGATPDEQVARALGGLGPITIVLGPWQRLQPDAYTIRAGAYPKLPADAPPTPGACPDLDVEAFVTFAHREAYWTALKEEVALLRRAAPNAELMQMLHPSMEAVYRPLQDRWPIAAEGILTPEGRVYEAPHYSRAWLGDYTDKDWGVLYYVPRPGSAYLQIILGEATRALDEMKLDGLYCDEFSWAFSRSGYSRYDYSRWDGYSADLDEDGNVVRPKADAASVTESCQLRLAGEVLRRGGYFLGNGGSALRSLNALPIARFIEGGNGAGQWPQGHLSATPLVLGNLGDEKTRAGVFESVKACLREGCLYSPTAVNLLLEGPDNFVSKLYPMTVKEIGPGWIVGEERIATVVSRSFPWPGGRVRRCVYDPGGELLDQPAIVETLPAGQIAVEVPAGGLAIFER